LKIPQRGGKGLIEINIEPGYDVYLDGKHLGQTPIKELKVASGRQKLIIKNENTEIVNIRFNVWSDKLNVFELPTSKKGNIEITTIPLRCSILIDDNDAGSTENGILLIENLDEGEHTIMAVAGGKRSQTAVYVKNGETVKITLVLNKK